MKIKILNFLKKIPSWGQALFASFITVVFLMIPGIFIAPFIKPLGAIADASPYVSYAIIISIACFYICKNNPKSIWYVPVLSNPVSIISAVIEPNFWITPMWMLVCVGWILSITGSVSGAVLGRKILATKS